MKLEDGKTINDIRTIKKSNNLLVEYFYPIESISVTEISIVVKNYGIIEDGKQGAGHKAWMFIDEIIIE